MAPGPPNLRSNPFALLDTSPKSKKKRKNTTDVTNDFFPSLPEIKCDDPKFIKIEATNSAKSLADFSCFAIHRSLNQISNDILSISQLRDGKLLLLVKNKTIAKKFINTKALIGICDISATFHEQLNFVKGTVYAPFLNNVDENEIVQELSSQGVVAVYKFQKTLDGISRPSGIVLLTFDNYTLPNKVNIAWNKIQVNQFIPSPMRCKTCQLLGHTAKFCNRAPTCVNCALPPHEPRTCTRTLCVNCAESHPASSKECTKFIQAKDILKIKTTNKCTMSDATKIYQQQSNTIKPSSPSFSTVLNNNANTQKTNTNIPIKNYETLMNYKQQQKHSNIISIDNGIKPANSINSTTNLTLTKNQINQNPLTKPNSLDSSLTSPTQTPNTFLNQNKTPDESESNFSNHTLSPISRPSSPEIHSPATLSSPNKKSHLYSPLPSLAQVLASSQKYNISDAEMST